MTTIENTTISKTERRMLGLGLDAWNNILLAFLGVAAFAAALVGIATYVTIQLAKQEAAEAKNELEAYKLTVAGQVADAKTEGIKAGETAGNALGRAAELEKEAANARLETERLKAVVSWRVISPETESKLEAALAAKPGSVNLRYTDNDPEALFLAIQFSQILSKAKWQIAAGALRLGNALVFGFALPDGESGDGKMLREAFAAAGVGFSRQLPPSDVQIGTAMATIAGAPTLMVGSRSPPQFP